MTNVFNWKYHGIVFDSRGRFDWMNSHVGTPISFCPNDNLCKIFFATRDKNNNVRVANIELNITKDNVDYVSNSVSEKPILDISPTGYFDDNALYPSCIKR